MTEGAPTRILTLWGDLTHVLGHLITKTRAQWRRSYHKQDRDSFAGVFPMFSPCFFPILSVQLAKWKVGSEDAVEKPCRQCD